MEQFEDSKEYLRNLVVKRLEEYPIEDLQTIRMVDSFLDAEVEKAGFTGTMEGKIYYGLKKAELLFDANIIADAVSEFKRIKAIAAQAGLANFVNENAIDFQKAVAEMLG